MRVEMIEIERLIPYARNARTHSDDQVAQIAASIREFGFTNPLLIRDDMTVIAGHGRLQAARKLGLAEVPCIRLSHLTPAQARAYVIADNRLAEQAGWDTAMLAAEIEDLRLDGFDIDLTGFDAAALDAMFEGEGGAGGEAPGGGGIAYQEKYAVLVACEDEASQERAFERLTQLGFDCKVLVN